MAKVMFNVVLYQPEIPPNTGNIIRLCANTGAQLHLIEPLGFDMQDRSMRRAGLDYHEYASVKRYPHWQAYLEQTQVSRERLFAFSTKGKKDAHSISFEKGDHFVFGSETQGLPQGVRDEFDPDHLLRLTMRASQRSLNLSNTVAIVVYEAWRQLGFV
jgi:tRNA (cytidine/uridine-2'-O-)-methyltransferase